MKKIIIEIGCFLSMPLISNPFLPIAISPDLAALDARPSPWGTPYSLAADAGKSIFADGWKGIIVSAFETLSHHKIVQIQPIRPTFLDL